MFRITILTDSEMKYSIKELELLAIVWAIEHCKNYVYRVQFKVVSDHKALMSILKPNRGNETFSSRLTRWVERLLPFDFAVVHVAGKTLGMADYLSRHPSNLDGASIKAEMLWNEWFTVNSVNSLIDVLDSSASERSKAAEMNDEKTSIYHVNEAKTKRPIEMQEQRNSWETSKISRSVTKLKARMSQSPSIRAISEKLLPANYAADKTIQKIIALVKNYNRTAVSRFPSPWREKFQSFSLDERVFVYG